MQGPIRVVFYGVGAMAREMVRILARRDDVDIVAAIDIDPDIVGRDLGSVCDLPSALDVVISGSAQTVLSDTNADVVMLTTTAFASEAEPLIASCLENGLSVVSIVQQLTYPLPSRRGIARRLDALAKNNEVKCVAVGINPGFIMDILPIACSSPCNEITHVTARRNVDFSPYGPDEMVHIGAGLNEEDFNAGATEGHIGHIGLLETVAMVADGLGLYLDKLQQTKTPIVAKTRRKTEFVDVPEGRVCGLIQTVIGSYQDETIMDFQMRAILAPDETQDGFTLGDMTQLAGQPDVDIRISREISQKGGVGTASVAVNAIPRLMRAAPGFHTQLDLGFPKIWREPVAFFEGSGSVSVIE